MKFGAHLQDAIIPEWQDYYLDYELLKKKLRKAEKEQPFTERDETEFVELLDSNLEKVYAFHKATLNAIREEIDACETSITEIVPSQDTVKDLALIQEKINNVADDINRLEKFSRFNYTGFLKIVKKHDRHTDYILRPMFMVRLNQCPFWKDNEEDSDALLIKLSELFSKVRHGGKSMSFQPPSSLLLNRDVIAQSNTGSRRTILKRFFVHTNDILELKTSVLRHLPVLVYRGNNNLNGQEDDIDPPISSLYLDNMDMDAYSSRVESAPASQIMRLRWYGSAKGNRSISVERRTLEDENRGELNDKFIIKDKYVNGYLHGDQTFLEKSIRKMESSGRSSEDIESFSNLVKDVQKQIVDKHMEPILRTYYKRTAFQIPGDTNVRMSLDTDLCFIREDSGLFPNEPNIRRPGDCWRRPDVDINFPFSDLKEDVEVNRYPYATFEIKLNLAPNETEPKWILDLENSGLLEEAYHFSKFVHGMAIMFDTRVPLLPYWLAQIDDDRKLLPILPSRSPSVSPKQFIQRREDSNTTSTRGSAHKQKGIHERTSLLRNESTPSFYDSVDQSIPSSSTIAPPEGSSSNTPSLKDQVGVLSRRFFSRTLEQPAEEPIVLPPGVKIPKKVVTPIRVEPKVFFANERTYFSWMKFGTMLATFSLALFNSGDAVGKICGILYTLVAISTLLYGVGLYYRRRELIRSRLAGPYDEMIGPTVICLALMFAVGMNAYLKFSIPVSGLFYFLM